MSLGGAAYTITVIAEAHADKRIASELAERVLVAEVEWLEPEILPSLIRWQGLDASTEYLTWAGVSNRYKAAGLALPHGGFREEKGVFDERRAKKALRLCLWLESPPAGVLMVRDTDGQTERAESLERARRSAHRPFAVILALPHPKREAWVLAGFDAADSSEKAALEEVRGSLGFDPCHHAHRLTAKGKQGKRNAKKTLESLMAPGSDREEACWRDAELAVLEERGNRSGLAAYLAEVRERLVPIVAGAQARKRPDSS